MGESINVGQKFSPWPKVRLGRNPDEQTYDAIQGQLQDAQQQAQQAAAGSALANLGVQKNLTMQEMPVDLTPLNALTDAWTGSQFAQSYKPVETVQGRRAMLQQLQNELSKTQQGMTEQQLQSLKAQLETQGRREDRAMQLEGVKAQRDMAAAIRGQARDDKLAEREMKYKRDAQDAWNKDPLAKEATAKFYEIEGVMTALQEAKTNPVLRGVLPARLAKLVEKGVMTDQDIARYSGSAAWASKFKQWVQQAEEGTLTDENLGYFTKLAEGFARDAEKAMNSRAALHAKQYANQTGKPVEQALYDITGGTIPVDILQPRQENSRTSSTGSPYKVGQVIDGYKFLGGDWQNEANYEKVK